MPVQSLDRDARPTAPRQAKAAATSLGPPARRSLRAAPIARGIALLAVLGAATIAALDPTASAASRSSAPGRDLYSVDARAAQTGAAPAPQPQPGEGEGDGSSGTPPARCIPVPLPATQPQATPTLVVDVPTRGVPERNGPTGRLLLGGRWYFQLDEERTGQARGLPTQTTLDGWQPVTVPHVWNATDTVRNRSGWGWYRKEFRLPRTADATERPTLWRLRFLGVRERATVWLNGRKLGEHSGGYTPFELDARGLDPRATNRLVVRASTMRGPYDLSHSRFETNACRYGRGGWWNFGGIAREVEIRPVYGIDIERVSALPELRCPTCSATFRVRAVVRNATARALRVVIAASARDPRRRSAGSSSLALTITPAGRAVVTLPLRIGRPVLWQPRRPALYRLLVSATGEEATRLRDQDRDSESTRSPSSTRPPYRASYVLYSGVRLIEVRPGGVLLLNGRPVRLVGASFHEDDPKFGAALGPRERRWIVDRLRDLGATITRSHYPPHPAILEALDRAGILYWAQPPVYQLTNGALNLRSVRVAAQRSVRQMVDAEINNPSVIAWSLGNEFALGDNRYAGTVGPGYELYLRATARLVRELDPTRLVTIDRAAPVDPTRVWHPAFDELDAIGVNEYFGWYSGRTEDLNTILGQFHLAYPDKPIFVTEFGAEATHDGPADTKGTFAFQTRFLLDHLAIHERRPWVAASIVWILRDFRVTPLWRGGNPNRPTPPWNNKGLIDETGTPKPAYWELRKRFRATAPFR